MIDTEKIRELVEAAVAESFDEHLRALHDDVVGRVLTSLSPYLEEASEPPAEPVQGLSGRTSASGLNRAISAIQQVSQQVEILKNLLDGAADFAVRSALFILRGNVAVGWQARGFADNDSIKAVMIDTGSSALGKVVQSYLAVRTQISEFDPKFDAAMGTQPDGECGLVPLVVRGKVAAVLYGDSGGESVPVDIAGLELLCRAAGDWIELQALRKAAGAPSHYPIPSQNAQPPSTQAPVTAATQKEEPKPVAQTPAAVSTASPERASAAAMSSAPAELGGKAVSVPQAAPGMAENVQEAAANAPITPEHGAAEEELHKKARRFAKLLVDEIILYNQRKVAEGRQHHDLYERLKDDIEKSRATYDKRYAQTSVAKNDYFTQAVVAGLADHNPVLLGSSFPR